MLVHGKHDSRLIFTNIKANCSSARNEQVHPQLLVPYCTPPPQKKKLLLLLCDLLLSVNINFDLLRNKLETTPVNLTHLNLRDVGLYTWFIGLKLYNGEEVDVFIAFRLPNRFNFYILTSPHPLIRMHIKFIVINTLELVPYR
jgi:hypothetical protein